MATSRRASALTRLDLPTLGGPSTATATPVPQPLAAPRVGEVPRDAAGEGGERAGDFRLGLRRQILVGEVDDRLQMGERADQVPAPPVIERRQSAARLAHRLAALGLGLGVDQVGDCLDPREVELAGEEGAAGEVARPGRGEAVDPPEREPDRLDRRPTAMEVELDEVLAGIARRRREAEREPVVEDLAGPGVADFHAHRAPRRRRGEPGQAFERGGGARPGDPEHRDRAPPRRGGQCEDGGPAHRHGRRRIAAAPPPCARADAGGTLAVPFPHGTDR